MPSTAAQMKLPLIASPYDSDRPATMLLDAFADPKRTSGFLPLAEDAVRADPGSPVILCLAATAALLDEHPERALVFLKRYSKRYVPTGTHHLLHALVLAQQNKFGGGARVAGTSWADFRSRGPARIPGRVGTKQMAVAVGCAASWREAGRPPGSARSRARARAATQEPGARPAGRASACTPRASSAGAAAGRAGRTAADRDRHSIRGRARSCAPAHRHEGPARA